MTLTVNPTSDLPQTADDARYLMKHFGKSLGEPLVEQSYGGNCLLYDANNTADPFHNIWVSLGFYLRPFKFCLFAKGDFVGKIGGKLRFAKQMGKIFENSVFRVIFVK